MHGAMLFFFFLIYFTQFKWVTHYEYLMLPMSQVVPLKPLTQVQL